MFTTRPRVAALLAAAALGLTLVGGLSASATGTAKSASTSGTATKGAADKPLHVMSYNLRYASDTPPNAWQDRRPVMREQLRMARPELIGTQEGVYPQLQDIAADLGPSYDSIGLGREGGSRGEFMMVFFDTRRLQPLEYDHFWLSDTPDVVGSQTWGGCCPRMVTWVRFLDKATEKQFYAVNTHFEAFDATTRSKSADLLLQRMGGFDPALPVIATGDFNEAGKPGVTVYDKLVTNGPLEDSWLTADRRSPLYATFHGYKPLTPNGDRIDWILTTPGVKVPKASINTFQKDGQYPSDHLPVESWLQLP
ncbi:endonuclease/exonuclease/phosphatase family metal-dependent hydrolase [Kribbella amoyensis]|uniref:Endonuclease/exonuclease/phosphatase family metal-dependent hydrolase n=1 Tax=Kribbella amoyensis TaxID=996641 RepID=A0A561BZ43_9ACTN|nr:endonuclease/exonuclease/phosphatase family protein [Kribbella amoyensis]TWD84077.1 endonuclease/exonuclease/phosphatase family metal-dependent hydrolase [Kribbella amoyensis]